MDPRQTYAEWLRERATEAHAFFDGPHAEQNARVQFTLDEVEALAAVLDAAVPAIVAGEELTDSEYGGTSFYDAKMRPFREARVAFARLAARVRQGKEDEG